MMKQYNFCSTSNRRIFVRPALLSRAASTCLLLFLSVPWFCEQFGAAQVPNMVSAAVPHMPTSAYAPAPAFPQATPMLTHGQEQKALVTVAVPSAPAANPGGPYQYSRPSSLVPASPASVPSLFCPPGLYTRDTQVLTARAASATSGATPAADASGRRITGKSISGAAYSPFPECAVRPLALPASTLAAPPSSVVVMPRATPSSLQPSAAVRRRSSRAGAYMAVTEGHRATSPPRTVIQQQPLQAARAHKTLCIRRTWPSSRFRESSAHVYTPLCAPVSTLHTYDPVAPPVLTTTPVAAMHPQRPGARAVIPRYGPAQAPGRGHVISVQEDYAFSEGERRNEKTSVHSPSRMPVEAEEHERPWTPSDFAPPPDSQFHVMGRAESARGAPLALLQMEIDDFCTKRFQALCASRGGRFCTTSPIVGRYGPGGANDAGGWRCYNKDEMSMDTRSVGCVDQCGSLMRCLGAAGPNTTSVAVPELDEWVLQRKWQHCSAYQQAADALCNFKTSGDLARYDLLRKRWMCLDLDDIAFEGRSYCVDNCGGPVPCVGGLVSGLVPKFTVHIVQHPDMERAFEAIQPCPDLNDVCIATVLNPPRCVKQSSTILIQRLSAQQERLDDECQQNRDDACRRKILQEECFRLWLARFDVGPKGEPRAWRCYPESVLDFTQISRCADGCGNLVHCRGGPTTPTPLAIDAPRAKEIMADPSYCSAYQHAGNNFCKHKYGAGFVARQHCKTFKWQCLNKDRLPSLGWTGCIGHCGEFTPCPAGVDETVEIPDVDDQELVRAITSVPDPCPPGEKCEPTKQAPPFCSVSRPRPTNLPGENE